MPDDVYRFDAPQRIKRGDLRDVQRATCKGCGHTWLAPVIGRCPRCASPYTETTDSLMIGAPRV